MRRSRNLEQYLVIFALLGFFIWITLPILKALLFGFFLALVFHPLQVKLQTRVNRWAAAGILTALLALVVLIPTLYVGLVLAQDARDLISSAPAWLPRLADSLSELWARVQPSIPLALNLDSKSLIARGIELLGDTASIVGPQLGGFAAKVPAIGLELFIGSLGFYFALLDGRKIVDIIERIMPFEREDTMTFFAATESTTRGVIMGSFLAGLAQGSLIVVAFLALDVPRPLFFGVMTFLLSLIPFVGSLPVCLGATVFLFAVDRPIAGGMMILVWAVTSSLDNIIKPLALKGQSSIHPLLGFIAVLGGLTTFGVTGLFLGPLIAALGIESVRLLLSRRETFA